MKKTSITIATITVLGLSLLSSTASAQGWRSVWGGWGNTSSCSGPTLRQDVSSVDRIADQMVCQFSREMHRNCPIDRALMSHLQKNAVLTQNLVTAHNGNCKCAFKKAACALNDSMSCLAKASRKVRNLSCSMRSNVQETIVLAKRIHKNADSFVPRTNSFTNRRPAPQAPVYGRPPAGNHNIDNDPFGTILSGLLNARFNR